ncbi:prisilkin-39-like [Neodiprion virginianus]|uniref:prisilkin-39-like n=1 Tax=Neodiprion virginianus TaxID=2961670 RepID=UPI001EE76D96|nr:prisilkin-39-like [Neodiprion virginianus]
MVRDPYSEIRFIRSFILSGASSTLTMQFLIVACALLGVALGQYNTYEGFPGYQGYQGYPGYQGYRGYQGYQGYPGYQGYQGYPGYQGYRGYPGFQPAKPVETKEKEIVPVKSVFPVNPVVTPVYTKGAYESGVYARILAQEQEVSPDGSYSYRYSTDNGISAAESGSPANGPTGPVEVVNGEYSYVAPDGTPFQVRYVADGNGFHPQGVHISTVGSGYARQYEGRALNVVAKPVEAAKNKKIVACALLGVALGQYIEYPGYAGYAGYSGVYPGYRGYSGYPGYTGYPGYRGYSGYSGYSGSYPGYAGYDGYRGYPGYAGYQTFKPSESKAKEAFKTIATVAEVNPVFPVVAPVVPIVPKALGSESYARIVNQDQASAPDGSYRYSYQTENGITAAESGSSVVGRNGPEEAVVGEYAYTAPDGTPIQVRYTADANGFHPQGVHIPSTARYQKRAASAAEK